MTSRSLHDLADEVIARLNAPTGREHDVSNEPRVPKGQGDTSGEWTTGQSETSADATANANNGGCPNGFVVMPMEVTAYTNGPESTQKRPGDPRYGITKSGAIAGPGTIAASPEHMNKKMYVPGYGWGVVQDTGGAIKGNRLDVWFEKVEDARRWGRQRLNIIVCK